MLRLLVMGLPLLFAFSAFSQVQRVAVIGSSTAAGEMANPKDSSWVNRFNHYYKRVSPRIDTTHNLAVSGLSVYQGLPDNFKPAAGRPLPDPAHNVSKAVALLRDLPQANGGVILVNFPSNGYNTYSIPDVMNALQLIYDSATRLGNRCYITTTQPRFDTDFNNPATKRKMVALKDSILNRFGNQAINFWDVIVNTADTTILPAYSAGDGVHLNNAGHRMLFNQVLAKNILADVILPLTWGSFQLVLRGSDVQLSWTTLQETQTAFFTVETATNATDFSSIGRLAAGGTITGSTAYQFTHRSPAPGLRFYRLRHTGLNGNPNYSAVKSVRVTPVATIATIQTNPVRQVLRLNVLQQGQATLTDFSGKTLLHMTLKPGIRSVDMSRYPAGKYNLLLVSNGNAQSIVMIKL